MCAAGQVFGCNLYFLLLCENVCDEKSCWGADKGFGTTSVVRANMAACEATHPLPR
jgi:hypothetical protein